MSKKGSSEHRLSATDLAGKVALVTGGSRGIGLAIARRLAGLRLRVAICARDTRRLEGVRQDFAAQGTEIFAVPADVTDSRGVEAAVQRVERDLGPIYVLVNNAGIGIFGPFHERSDAEWDRVLGTNLKGVFLMSRAVVPGMIRRGEGHIVNIGSLAGKSAFAGGGLYCASKWGLMGLTACMAEELREFGIRVAVICPGSVATDFSNHSGRPAEKLLQPDDVAHAVSTLLTQGPQSFISEVDLRPFRKS